jgi:DNA-directed RNA polymerase subunit RPC12/RpoP
MARITYERWCGSCHRRVKAVLRTIGSGEAAKEILVCPRCGKRIEI